MVYFMYHYLCTQAKDKIFERKKKIKKNQRVNIKVLTRQRVMAYLLG